MTRVKGIIRAGCMEAIQCTVDVTAVTRNCCHLMGIGRCSVCLIWEDEAKMVQPQDWQSTVCSDSDFLSDAGLFSSIISVLVKGVDTETLGRGFYISCLTCPQSLMCSSSSERLRTATCDERCPQQWCGVQMNGMERRKVRPLIYIHVIILRPVKSNLLLASSGADIWTDMYLAHFRS